MLAAKVDWDDLRHFLALARTCSVRAAGATLGVSHSTVSRRVEGLESRLQVKLFDRARDGYLLTDAGNEMVLVAERVEREMDALQRGLAGQDTRLAGPVRVTCTDPYLGKLLLSALAELCRKHAGIELALDADPKYLDLTKREADLAVRALLPSVSPPEHMIARRVAPITICSYVARTQACRLDPEQGGRELRWIGSSMRKIDQQLVASSSYPEGPIWGAFESLPLLVEAAHAGLGIAMLPTYVGDPEPRLQRITKPDLRHVADFWLVSHRDLRDNARVRAARECLTQALAHNGALFRGELECWRESAPLHLELAPGTARPRP